MSLSTTQKKNTDEKLRLLHSKKKEWAMLSLRKKRRLIEGLQEGIYATATKQIEAAILAKGVSPKSPEVAEEWLAGPMVTLRNLRYLAKSLDDLIVGKKPQLPSNAVRVRPDGKTVARVFPSGHYDKVMYSGFSGEIWMQDDVTPENIADTQAVFYDEENPKGALALVLGAGNVASIGPLDVVYKLFVEGQVCILKMNPVNDYLGKFIEEAFAEFIDAGYLAMAYGGAAMGEYLCQHEHVEEIHITGSDRTHDAIVFGVGKEGEKRKKENKPQLDKRITSELGNVSPIIVIPGKWSAKELTFQAENVVTQLVNNGGFNCNAARVIITHASWPQREAFLDQIREVFAKVPKRVAYYPGAEDRWNAFCTQNPEKVEKFGTKAGDVLPWTLISNLDSEVSENICFTTEAFAGVISETPLRAPDVEKFIIKATAFCNEQLWGTLSSEIIVDPRTEKTHSQAVDTCIADLKYGSVAVNHWPAIAYALGVTTWGAYPGHRAQDIQSGVGIVHNTYMFDKPEKTVIRGPFSVFPKPPWFVTNGNAVNIAKRLVDFEREPGMLKLGKVVAASLRG